MNKKKKQFPHDRKITHNGIYFGMGAIGMHPNPKKISLNHNEIKHNFIH